MKGNGFTKQSIGKVVGNIRNLYRGFEDEAYEVSKEFAAKVSNEFWNVQTSRVTGSGAFWTNQTFKAASKWYARAYRFKAGHTGFYASHGRTVEYATDLENWVLSKQGATSTEALIAKYAGEYMQAIQDIYKFDTDLYYMSQFLLDPSSFNYTQEEPL